VKPHDTEDEDPGNLWFSTEAADASQGTPEQDAVPGPGTLIEHPSTETLTEEPSNVFMPFGESSPLDEPPVLPEIPGAPEVSELPAALPPTSDPTLDSRLRMTISVASHESIETIVQALKVLPGDLFAHTSFEEIAKQLTEVQKIVFPELTPNEAMLLMGALKTFDILWEWS
jgi:hypothetical protein